MCTCTLKKKTLPFILLFYWKKKIKNRDKDGQSGIFMPFGVKQQKLTLAADIALKKNNVDVALLYTVIER